MDTATPSTGRKSFLEGLSGIFKSPTTNAPAQNVDKFKTIAANLNSAVQNLKSELDRKREETRRSQVKASSTSTIDQTQAQRDATAKFNEEQRARALETAQSHMRASVLQLHRELGTNIDERQLTELEQAMADYLESGRGMDMDARIRAAIVDKLYAELGELAWDKLQALMTKRGLSWEEPDSRSQHASSSGEHKNYRAAEVQELFLSQTKEQALPALSGVVTIWKSYPDEKSWLWRDVALRSVGTGIRVWLLRIAVEKLRADAPMVRAKGEELLQGRLNDIHTMLQSGIQSIEEADLAVSGADKVVKEFLPGLAWDWVTSLVNERAAAL